MSYKFIFDTNVLNEKSVKELRSAGIVEGCNSGRLAFYMTPILMQERFQFAGKGKIHPDAIEPVKLLIDIKWQRLFNQFGGSDGIFAGELEGRFQRNYLFINHDAHKRTLSLFLAGGEFDNEGKHIITDDWCQWTKKKKNNKETYRLMRQDVNEIFKKHPSLSRKKLNFSTFLNLRFESTALNKIESNIQSRVSKEQLMEYWVSHKEQCIYFNKYIEGYLFIEWYYVIASEQEPRIDINAHDDIHHLMYLVGVDGIVSEEQLFIKPASGMLFPKRDFMSVEQFIDRMKHDFPKKH